MPPGHATVNSLVTLSCRQEARNDILVAAKHVRKGARGNEHHTFVEERVDKSPLLSSVMFSLVTYLPTEANVWLSPPQQRRRTTRRHHFASCDLVMMRGSLEDAQDIKRHYPKSRKIRRDIGYFIQDRILSMHFTT